MLRPGAEGREMPGALTTQWTSAVGVLTGLTRLDPSRTPEGHTLGAGVCGGVCSVPQGIWPDHRQTPSPHTYMQQEKPREERAAETLMLSTGVERAAINKKNRKGEKIGEFHQIASIY